MRSIEQRIRIIEEMIAEIHARVVLDRPPNPAEYERAIQAIIAGDKKPLDLYLARGGRLSETPRKPYKPYTPKKKPDCNPVMLPAKERGASSVNIQ